MGWRSAQEPGAWQRIMRIFKDGHTEQWWAVEVTTLIHHGPEKYLRLVAVTTDPATLPTNSSWYLMSNIPAPGYRRARESSFEAADLAEIVRIYGLRQWIEQSYRQLKGELGFADFEVRSDRAIRRHWELVFCAFCFCWWAYFREQGAAFMDLMPESRSIPEAQPEPEKAGKKERPNGRFPLRHGRQLCDKCEAGWTRG